MDIKANLEAIAQRIGQCSPYPEKVQLVAVSKTKPASMVQDALDAGQLVFGENRVQEARDKAKILPQAIQWHLIGPLQKNKAKYCPHLFDCIHSLNSIELALALEEQCLKKDAKLKVLIQMNLTGEATKSGLQTTDELKRLSDQVLQTTRLELIGLMSMGDPGLTPDQNRPYFAKLRQLCEAESKRLSLPNMNELSMGMSGDFEQALTEGATLIRVGSAIFGGRGSEGFSSI